MWCGRLGSAGQVQVLVDYCRWVLEFHDFFGGELMILSMTGTSPALSSRSHRRLLFFTRF